MAVVLKALARGYTYLYYDLRGGWFFVWFFFCYLFSVCFIDTRTDDFWLVNTPLPVLTILGLYYYFVTDFGPRFMKNRPPFELKKVLVVYNLIQILINVFICFEVGLFDLFLSW